MKSMRLKKFKGALYALPLLFFAGVIIIFPERYLPLCLEGIALWAECVVPSLFPFMAITMLLIKSGAAARAAKPLSPLCKRVRLPDISAVILLMSVCSGYPAGSRIVCEFYENGQIGNQAKKLSLFCSTSGPLFIVASVGFKMFGDKTLGMALLAAHLVSVFSVALVYSLTARDVPVRAKLNNVKTENLLYDSFYSAVIACLVAGGFICFFYTFAGAAEDFNLLFPLKAAFSALFGEKAASALCYGLIEATGGCAKLAASASPAAVPLCGFLITFGGLSIFLQQLCYLIKCGVKPTFFISFKFLQGLVCFALLWLYGLF